MLAFSPFIIAVCLLSSLTLLQQLPETRCTPLGETALNPENPYYHYSIDKAVDLPYKDENESKYWTQNAISSLQEKLEKSIIKKKAKNLILFLGDGMSVPTVAAARIYLGQLEMKAGENSRLSFEEFPFTGYSKTYCVDKQVADSACTSTAYTGGVKANYGTLGVTAAVARGNCTASLDPATHVTGVVTWAQTAGKATGIVTTASVTDASPAGAYSHSADRDWQSDKDLRKAGAQADACKDIAQQLVRNKPGSELKVILGGGRKKFLPETVKDKSGVKGERLDGANLIQEWLDDKKERKATAKYFEDRTGLLESNTTLSDYIMGLFRPEHMNYYLEPAAAGQPTLEEMTRVAIERLQREPNGYYLFVEGALIDKAHHQNWAQRALAETVEFAKAIKLAESMTNKEDTLIVVTADHAHTMSFSGYPRRGNNILSTTPDHDMKYSYSTLGYMNGPSAKSFQDAQNHHFEDDNMMQHDYRFPSLFQLEDETHGGDDVAVYARGPWSHLFVGTYEQHLIPHMMAFAAKIGAAGAVGSSATFTPSAVLLTISTLLLSFRIL